MADEIKPVQIRIDTVATGGGAEQTVAKVERITQATTRLTDASMLLTAEEAAGQQALMALTDQIAALEAKKQAILNDRTPRIIDATTAAGAAASPDNQVAALSREIEELEAERLATERQITGEVVKQAAAQKTVIVSKEEQAKIEAEIAAAKELELTKLAQQASVEGEILAIRENQKELALAKARGDDLTVEKLTAEINVRKMTLVELKEELATRAQLAEIEEGQAALLNDTLNTIDARVEARKLELATMEAQEALNAELIAQEEARLKIEQEQVITQTASEKVYGRGRAGMLARNFGFDANTAASLGIGVMFGVQVYEAIMRYTEALKKANDERDRASAKELESEERTMREIRNLYSLAKAQQLRASLEDKLNEALDERRNLSNDATDDQRDLANQKINDLRVEINAIDRANSRTVAREEAARKVKEQEEATRDAINEQIKLIDQGTQAAHRRLDALKQINAAQAEADIAKINARLASGEITEDQAAKQREGITGKRDAENSAADQSQRQADIDAAQKQADIAAQAAADQRAKVEEARKAQQDASDKRAEMESKNAAAEKLAVDAKEAQRHARELATVLEASQNAGGSLALVSKYGVGGAQEKVRDATPDAIAAAQKQAAEMASAATLAKSQTFSGKDIAAAQQAADLADKTLKAAQDKQDKLDEKAKETADQAKQRTDQLKEEIALTEQLNQLHQQRDKYNDQARESAADKKDATALIQDYTKKVETVISSKRPEEMNGLVQAIDRLIGSNTGFSTTTVDTFKALQARIEAVEKKQQEHTQALRHVNGGY